MKNDFYKHSIVLDVSMRKPLNRRLILLWAQCSSYLCEWSCWLQKDFSYPCWPEGWTLAFVFGSQFNARGGRWDRCPVPSGRAHTACCSSHAGENPQAILLVLSVPPPAKHQMSEHVVEWKRMGQRYMEYLFSLFFLSKCKKYEFAAAPVIVW